MDQISKHPYVQHSVRRDIEESKLNHTDRLGLAWCRLNCHEWDSILGPEPKEDISAFAMKAIENIIGKANVNRCWWLFVLGKTESEWLQWYVVERFQSKS